MTTHMLKPDGRPDQLVLPGLDCPALYSQDEARARRRQLVQRFDAAQKTESAFYLVFNALSTNDLAYLSTTFGLDADWELFRMLCRLYKVMEA